jgi:Phosphotransferase enzyme family
LKKWTVGDRLAAFGVLLPAMPTGPVVLAVSDNVATALRFRFPDAVLLNAGPESASNPQVVRWDGRHSPLRAKSVGLLVVDARLVSVEPLRSAVTEEGTLAVLGAEGPYVLYPGSEWPEQIWRRGWPIPAMRGAAAQARRTAGLWGSRQRGAPRLEVVGRSTPSLVERVLADVATATGVHARLVGVHTAGHTILRLRSASSDIAVRMSFCHPDLELDASPTVVADVPSLADVVPREIARGTTCGCPWAVNTWVPSRRYFFAGRWRPDARRWAFAAEVAGRLQTVRTGATGHGWARTWCDSVGLLPPAVADLLVPVLGLLEDGIPTAWCHGDLWPGNVLLDGRRGWVIDWDNVTRNAPEGLDWLLIAALKIVDREPNMTAAAACLQMVDNRDAIDQPVAGRRWREWDRETRLALAVAAFLLILRNRSFHDLGETDLQRNLEAVVAGVAPNGRRVVGGPDPNVG